MCKYIRCVFKVLVIVGDCVQYLFLYRLLISVAGWVLKVLRYVCVALKIMELVLQNPILHI